MLRGHAAVLVAVIIIQMCVFGTPAWGGPFTNAYGTFKDPQLAIDDDPKTYAETSKAYRNEYFLISRFPNQSFLRTLNVVFDGKKPKDYVIEMGMDAVNWRPYEPGEKALYVRVRILGVKDGEVYRIAELTVNSEVAAVEPFGVTRMSVDRIETTTALIQMSFTKPARVSMAYGLEPTENALKNFTEYTSYQANYQIGLTDLIEGVDYYVRIKAFTPDGEMYVTWDTEYLRFRTLGTAPLKLLSVGVGYLSPLSLSLVVQTNIPSNCVLYFGEQSFFTDIRNKPTFDTLHTFEFKDLSPNHMYSYMVFLTDFRGLNAIVPKRLITTSGVNIAKNKRVIEGTFTQVREASFQGGPTVVGETTLQKLTDGRNDYFGGMAHSQDLTRADQYAVIDLGKVYTLESHLTFWRTLAFPYSYQIHVSQDRKTWTNVFTMATQRMGAGEKIRSGAGDPILMAGGPLGEGRTKARYVKLLVPKGTEFFKRHSNWTNVDLAEIVIYPGGEYEEIKRIVDEEWQP